MKDTNKLNPEIRFSGFTDDWEERKLGELALVLTGFPFKNEDFVDNGKYLVITNGNIQNESSTVDVSLGNRVDDLSDEIKERYYLNKNDILVTMDGTVGRTAKVVDDNLILAQRVARLVANKNTEFVYQWLNQGSFFNEMTKVSHGGTIKHISLNEISNYSATVPSNNIEQQKIGSFFKQLDDTITLHQRKLDKLKTVKKAMLEKMFPKNGESVPEIRFSGFTDDWEQRKLREVADKTYGGGTPKTSIEEYWQGNIPWIQSQDLSENKVFGVEPRKYINQKAIENSATKIIPKNSIAIITRVGVGKLALMPISYCTSQDFLSLSSLKINELYATYVIYKMLQIEKEKVQGTSIKGITSAELLSKKIDVPIKYAEQQKIGEYFSNLDHLITLHQRKLDKLKTLKKAMLEKMFI